MPSPVGHSLVGYLVARQVFGTNRLLCRPALICVAVGNLPDLDFIPGALAGQPNLYHHAVSHSIGFGLLACGLLAMFFAGTMGLRRLACFALFFVLYGSHLFLDYLSASGREPFGIPAFWPLSGRYFISPIPVLPGVAHSGLHDASILQFLDSALSMYNLRVILIEILMVSSVVILNRFIVFLFKTIRTKTTGCR